LLIYLQYKNITKNHQLNILVQLINFLVKKNQIEAECFSLYQFGIENQIFVINGKMRNIEIVNTYTLGVSLGKFEWVDHFLLSHEKYFPENERKYLTPFLKSYKALFKDNYQDVISLLKNVSPENNLFYLTKIKSLLIRAFFLAFLDGKIEFSSILDNELLSFQKLIERNKKLANNKKQSLLNFHFVFKKLFKLIKKDSYTQRDIKAVEQIMQQQSLISYQMWLQKELDKIKKAVLSKENGKKILS